MRYEYVQTRLLAASDVFATLTEALPYRSAFDAAGAAKLLLGETTNPATSLTQLTHPPA